MSQDDGRVALVSGGSHGIGAATVRRLAASGWEVSFCYRDDGPSVRQVEKDASELGVRFGVSVNAVVPGLVAHDMADLVPEQARGDLTETIAIRRFGNAAAVANLVASLLSEEAADITGTVLEARSVISLLTGVTSGR